MLNVDVLVGRVWKDESSFTISNVEAHIPGMTTYGLSGDKSETFQATCALSADSCNAMPTTKCDVLTKTPNTDFGRSIGRRELDHKGCQHLGHSCGTFNGVNYGNCCAQSEKSPPTSMECIRDGDNSLVVNGRVQYRKKCDDCFPSAATVLRLSEGTAAWTRIDSLRRGDLIAAVDEQDRFFFDEVAFSSLADPTRLNEAYLRLMFGRDGGHAAHNLTLTAGHHLPVGPTCCAHLKIAGEVTVGETVWLRDGKRTSTASAPYTVTAITQTLADGMHSPMLLHGGMPIVDGVVTSFGSISDVRAAATIYPFVGPLATALGLSHTAARIDNLGECMLAKASHLWAGGSLRSIPACPARSFVKEH